MNVNNEKWSEARNLVKEGMLCYPVDGIGSYYTTGIFSDVKHVAFQFARYKFVAKMLSRINNLSVLELGCNEGIGALMLAQNCNLKNYVGIDMDESAIEWNKRNVTDSRTSFIFGDFFDACNFQEKEYGCVFSLDVIEHIKPELEKQFIKIMYDSVSDSGTVIVGTPNIMMSPYASPQSKIAHINLYDQDRLYKTMNSYFNNVFIFNMNDEMINVSFDKMSCYMFAICCNKKAF